MIGFQETAMAQRHPPVELQAGDTTASTTAAPLARKTILVVDDLASVSTSVAFDTTHRGTPDRRLVYGSHGTARVEVDPSGATGSILESNRHMRDVLRAKGYAVDYHEFASGHDYLNWRGTLADGLVQLLGKRR